MLLTLLTGLKFIHNYRADYAYLSPGLLELKDVEKEVDLSGCVLLTLPEHDPHAGFRENFIRSLFAGKLVHPGFFPQQDFSDSRDSPVALVVRRSRLLGFHDAAEILWSGSEYVILNTGLALEQAWTDRSRICWAPQPRHIPRPEIEVQWNEKNRRDQATLYYGFSAFYQHASRSTASEHVRQ